MKKIPLVLILILSLINSSCINKDAQERQRFVQDSIKAEQARLDSINNLGIWKIEYYVDEFGDHTNRGYVTTEINGTFSNSATTNSPLRVKLAIDTSVVLINLYEYAGNHPVKGEGYLQFTVKDSAGIIYNIETYNDDYGNNTVKDDSESEKTIRSILSKGGEIKFSGVANKYSSPSEYKFTITNTDYLEKALNRIRQTLERKD